MVGPKGCREKRHTGTSLGDAAHVPGSRDAFAPAPEPSRIVQVNISAQAWLVSSAA